MNLPARELVGRDADLARIAEIIGAKVSDPAAEHGIVVSGDAGIGKSSLLARVSADAEAARWNVAWGHCVGQSGGGVAYELLARLELLAPQAVEQIVTTRPALAVLLPGWRDPATSNHSPGQVAESVHALLTAVGEIAPLLVIIEDAHWTDPSSRDLMTLLLTRGFASPVALVVTYRSDDLHRRHPLHETLAIWARIAGVEHHDLQPLDDSAIRAIVTATETNDMPDRTVGEIARRAEGNPFFAEQLAASTVAGQPVTGGHSRVLWARVDQLSEAAQHVVRTMAIGGRTISHDLLLRLVDLTEEQLEVAVAEAIERHVIEAQWPPAYAFRHALLAETTTADLLPGQRMRLHRAYAGALASDPSLGPASELARHAAASGDLTTAVSAARDAARADLLVGGPVNALQHLEDALGWLPEDAEERDVVSLEASDAALTAGDVVRSVHLLRDRIEHPGADQTPAMRARLLATCATRVRLIDLTFADSGPDMTTEAMALVPGGDSSDRLFVLTAHMQQLVDTRHYDEASTSVNRRSPWPSASTCPMRSPRSVPSCRGSSRFTTTSTLSSATSTGCSPTSATVPTRSGFAFITKPPRCTTVAVASRRRSSPMTAPPPWLANCTSTGRFGMEAETHRWAHGIRDRGLGRRGATAPRERCSSAPTRRFVLRVSPDECPGRSR